MKCVPSLATLTSNTTKIELGRFNTEQIGVTDMNNISSWITHLFIAMQIHTVILIK